MTDAQAAKLRALAERAPQDTFMAVDNCVYSLTRDGERNRIWMDIYVHRKHGEVREGTDLAAYIAAASPDVVTALLDERDALRRAVAAAVDIVEAEGRERDAAMALLRECRELVSPPLSGTERRLADRIDAMLGDGGGEA